MSKVRTLTIAPTTLAAFDSVALAAIVAANKQSQGQQFFVTETQLNTTGGSGTVLGKLFEVVAITAPVNNANTGAPATSANQRARNVFIQINSTLGAGDACAWNDATTAS